MLRRTPTQGDERLASEALASERWHDGIDEMTARGLLGIRELSLESCTTWPFLNARPCITASSLGGDARAVQLRRGEEVVTRAVGPDLVSTFPDSSRFGASSVHIIALTPPTCTSTRSLTAGV